MSFDRRRHVFPFAGRVKPQLVTGGNNRLNDALEAEAKRLGLVAFGVADAGAAPKTASRLRAWLEQGRHGDMIWMAEPEERRGRQREAWDDVGPGIMPGLLSTGGRAGGAKGVRKC